MMQQQQMNPHQAMYGQHFGQTQMMPSYGAQQMNFMGAGMGGMMQMMPQIMTQQQGFQMYQGGQGGGYGASGGHGGGGAGRKRKQGGGHQNAKKWKK